MYKVENRDSTNKGRRAVDKWTPKMLIATGLVNLSGAPAKIAVQYGMVAVVIWVIGDAILKVVRELKGTNTFADIQIGLQAALSINPESGQASPNWPLGCELLLYSLVGTVLIASVAIFYAYRERALRNQTIHDMGLQITTLEKYFDRSRSSSGLTKTGSTHPEDM